MEDFNEIILIAFWLGCLLKTLFAVVMKMVISHKDTNALMQLDNVFYSDIPDKKYISKLVVIASGKMKQM